MRSPLVQFKPEENAPAQPQKSNRSERIVLTVLLWLITISIWSIIGYLTIYIYFLNEENEKVRDERINSFSMMGIIIYCIYLIIELLSPTAFYLCNKRSHEGIKKTMGKILLLKPEIKFHIECYHYETEHYTETDSEGNKVEKTRQVVVTTHRETEYFDYYSIRDVSGLLTINCNETQMHTKSYIKLELLKEELNFADAISVKDYEAQKEAFQNRNKDRDEYMTFNEYWSLPGINHFHLIKIGNYEPCTVNCFWYFIFTLFTLAQVYKLYVESFCIYQTYKIRKIISTRYNLNSKAYDSQYKKFNPQINLITLKIDYEPAYYSYLNTSKSIKLPSNEELESAKVYDNKVPKYSIYTEDDGVFHKTGTVKDNPDFANFNMQINNNIGNNKNQNKKGKKNEKKDEGYNSIELRNKGYEESIWKGINSQGSINSPDEGNNNNQGNINAQPNGGNIFGQSLYDNQFGGGNIYGH